MSAFYDSIKGYPQVTNGALGNPIYIKFVSGPQLTVKEGNGSEKQVAFKNEDNQFSVPQTFNKGVTITAEGLSITGGNLSIPSNGGTITAPTIKTTNAGVTLNNAGLTLTSDANIAASNSTAQFKSVSAQWYNATSDKRAKTQIEPLSNVLDFILKTNIYSFYYKNNLKTKAVGIIAQEVEDDYIDEFNLVEPALDKDGFMAIRESKICYLLWKAVQEQQEMINNLQEQINELKK